MMSKLVKSCFVLSAALGAVAVAGFYTGVSPAVAAEKAEKQQVVRAIANLHSAPDGKAGGRVVFEQQQGGVRISGDVHGLTPGLHGFHIHENGVCSEPDFSSAGGHFSPGEHKHGAPDGKDRHVGDLGNLEADEEGNAQYSRVDSVLSLDGSHSIIGRAVIVHEKADDLKSQPTGDAGGRVACGIIGIAE